MIRRARFTIGQALTSMVRAPILQLVAVSTIGAAVMVFCLLQVVTNTAEQFVVDFSVKLDWSFSESRNRGDPITFYFG